MTTQVDVRKQPVCGTYAAIPRSNLAPERLSQWIFASSAELRIVQRNFFANGHESDLHGRKWTERIDRNGPVLDAVRRQAFDLLESRHFKSVFQTMNWSAL
jgi:hypothetical protein